ncbi:MAG: pentapeptide repeat-containing protein [Cyanobacteria bacterium J06598_1]
MQPQMLLQRYKLGKRDFSWADLQGADLSQQDLSDINLYRANLAGANLKGANLTGANLFKASLAEANLTGANLTATNFCKADLQAAIVEQAALKAAKLRGAILPDGSCYQPAEPDRSPDRSPDIPPDRSVVDAATGDSSRRITQPDTAEVTPAEATLLWAQLEACELATVAQQSADTPVLDTNEPLWCLGMAGVIAGFICFGVVMHANQMPVYVWLLVWSSIFAAEGKPESVWVVPITAAAIVTLFSEQSLLQIILTAIIVLMNGSGLLFYGSILGQRAKKTMQDGIFLCALCFVALNLNLLVGLGVVGAAFGFLFLLRESQELGKLTPLRQRTEDPWVRRRRLIEQRRFFKQFGIAALIGLGLSGVASWPG